MAGPGYHLTSPFSERRPRAILRPMDWRDLLPGVIGSFVGVMGWLAVGIYIQRRQFVRQARNAAKAVSFELDENRSTVTVAREHPLFANLDRSSFERLLPELATLLAGSKLRTVVDAYMTHAGYRQLASREDLPTEVRRAALGAYVEAHQRALTGSHWWAVNLFELGDGRISRMRTYFAPDFEAPAWRAPYREAP